MSCREYSSYNIECTEYRALRIHKRRSVLRLEYTEYREYRVQFIELIEYIVY